MSDDKVLQELALIRNRLDVLGGHLDDIFFMLREMNTPVYHINNYEKAEPIAVIPQEPAMSEPFNFRAPPTITTDLASVDPDTVAIPIKPVGLTRDTGLKPGFTATIADQISIKDREITGGLTITGKVEITNCRFTGDGTTWHGLKTESGGSATLKNCVFTGDWVEAAFAGNNITLEDCLFTGLKGHGGLLGNNTKLINCKIVDFAGDSPHDGLQIMQPVGAVQVIDCEIVVPAELGNAALVFSAQKQGVPDSEPILISGCTLGGGGYTVAFDDSGAAGSFGVLHFVGNKIGPGGLWQAKYPNGYNAEVWKDNEHEDGRTWLSSS